MNAVITVAVIAAYITVGWWLAVPRAVAHYRKEIEDARRDYPFTWKAHGPVGVDHTDTYILAMLIILFWPLFLVGARLIRPIVDACRGIDRDYVETVDEAEVRR